MKGALEALASAALGFMAASLFWAARLPDQRVEGQDMCVPIYYGGLECCQD